MAYTPENNPYIPGDPYSYDLKWLVSSVKNALSLYGSLSGDFVDLYNYVHTFFSNPEFQEHLEEALNELINDGTIASMLSPMLINVKNIGMVADDPAAAAENTSIFKTAIQNKQNLFFPEGVFYMNNEEIDVDNPIMICGTNSSTSVIKNATIAIKADVTMFKIRILEAKDANDDPAPGVVIYNRCIVVDTHVSNCKIGFDISQATNHVAYAMFINCISAWNTEFGYKIVHNKTTAQKNMITFIGCMAASNGSDVSTPTADATTTYGDGFYIDGGYANTLYNCCSEFNSGCGIKIVVRSNTLNGLHIDTPYLESNKYTNIYVDQTNDVYGSIEISNIFYTDRPTLIPDVSNALPIRGVCLSDGIMLTESVATNTYSGPTPRRLKINDLDTITLANGQGEYQNKLVMNNLLWISLYSNKVRSNEITTYNKVPCLKFTNSAPATSKENYMRAYNIRKGHAYKISMKALRNEGSATPRVSIESDTGSFIGQKVFAYNPGLATEFLNFEMFYYPDADMPFVQFQINNLTPSADFEAIIGDIQVEEVHSSYGTSAPPIEEIGFTFFNTSTDTTTTWNGTAWV